MAKVNKKTETTKSNKKSRLKEKHPIVRICLSARANNSIVALTDMSGQILAWSSSGKVGFKGTRKSTPFTAQKATEEILEKAKMVDATTVHLFIDGCGIGRDSFIRAIQSANLQVESIHDRTSFPYGGVKPHNYRRV